MDECARKKGIFYDNILFSLHTIYSYYFICTCECIAKAVDSIAKQIYCTKVCTTLYSYASAPTSVSAQRSHIIINGIILNVYFVLVCDVCQKPTLESQKPSSTFRHLFHFRCIMCHRCELVKMPFAAHVIRSLSSFKIYVFCCCCDFFLPIN